MATNVTNLQSPFRPPPQPIVDKNGQMFFAWVQYFDIAAAQLQTPANQPIPAKANQPGKHGQTAVGGGFYYVYDGTVGKWIKFAPVPF